MSKKQITIYLTDVVDGWVAWDGFTWDESSGAILDKDRNTAINRFKSGLLKRDNLKPDDIEFVIHED